MHKSKGICRSASLFIHFYTIRWQHIFKAKGYTPKAVITLIPPRIMVRHPYPALSHVQASVMSMLMCPICLATLQQPIQLPCHMGVCKECMYYWLDQDLSTKQMPLLLWFGLVAERCSQTTSGYGKCTSWGCHIVLLIGQQGVRASDCDQHKCGRRQCSKLQLQISCACPYGQLTNQYTLEELYIPCS